MTIWGSHFHTHDITALQEDQCRHIGWQSVWCWEERQGDGAVFQVLFLQDCIIETDTWCKYCSVKVRHSASAGQQRSVKIKLFRPVGSLYSFPSAVNKMAYWRFCSQSENLVRDTNKNLNSIFFFLIFVSFLLTGFVHVTLVACCQCYVDMINVCRQQVLTWVRSYCQRDFGLFLSEPLTFSEDKES